MTRPLRVLVLNERDPTHPRAGGAEVHVAEIARRLAARGFAITQYACSHRGAPAAETVAGMAVRRLGPLPIYYPRAAFETRRETRRGRFDAVVECLNKLPFFAPAYAAVPVLAVSHHLFGASAFAQAPWPIAAAVVALERLIPRVYRDVPFLAISESSRQDLVARGIPADHIGVSPPGADPPAAAPRPMAERPCRIVYLGRLERYKRVDLLLSACASLAPRFPALEIAIVGRGAERERLEALARDLGLASRTRFAGFVDAALRDRLVADARVAVFPSVKEGWGLSAIECNALGVPVVATDAPGLRDSVRQGQTGVLVPDAAPEAFAAALAQALDELLRDEARLARLAAGAQSWARHFDWDTAADEMAQALFALVEPGEALP
jgi:glycosyltransferase involved in cell wall biosynthesis